MANKFLDFIKQNNDIELALANERDSELLYQFSSVRKNIIEWYDFPANANVLEVGAGCGTVTEFLATRVKKVTALEVSEEYYNVNIYRNSEKENVQIICGDLSNIPENEKYDYIIVLGAFEKCSSYMNGLKNNTDKECELPDMLIKHLKKSLNEDGLLMLALNNKYGLKYFAGVPDDITGALFTSIEHQSVDGNKLYSRDSIEKLLKNSFNEIEFYYPMPDYMLAMEIYSDEYQPSSVNELAPSYMQNRMLLFNEKKAFDNICRDGEFSRFANSFFILCK